MILSVRLIGGNIVRRSDREVKDFDEIIKIVEKCDVCRLAFSDEEYPYIVPLNFGHQAEDGKLVLYFHGANEGKKYDLIEKNNRAGFEMDCSHRLIASLDSCSCTMEYESVIGNGLIQFVPEEEKYDALCILMKHYHHEGFPFNEAVIPKTKVFKLTVDSMSAKRRMKRKD